MATGVTQDKHAVLPAKPALAKPTTASIPTSTGVPKTGKTFNITYNL